MPIAPIKFRPGINTTFTPRLNEGGWSACNLIRFLSGLPQKVGGWTKYWPFSMATPIRALCVWRDFNGINRVGVGAETELGVITNGVLADITPQSLTDNLAPDFETTSASAVVAITDPGINTVTVYDAIYLPTPVSVGGLVLSGLYPITLVTGATSYEITAASNATATVATVAITGATQANPCEVTAVAHGRSNGDYVYIDGVVGMTELNGAIYEVDNVTADTFELVGIDSTGYTAYVSGGTVYGGIVPQFTTTSGTSAVDVTLPNHGLSVGGRFVAPISTTVGGITIQGTYTVTTVASVDEFSITASQAANATATVAMNGGEARIVYYIALGPAPVGAGYGLGTYGTGAYGIGSSSSAQTGTPITASDWTLDVWGQTLVACPDGGGIYVWDPNNGFSTAQLISTDQAPLYNAGIFVAQPAQILVAYGSTTQNLGNAIGSFQDPLLVRWCDQDDYLDWAIDTTDQVGSVRIPSGSRIVGGMQAPNQALIWTDVSVWSMQYVGPPLVFAFNKIADGAGLIGKHAAAVLQGGTYWMGPANFYALAGKSVETLPCTVWDDVFQDLDTTNQHKCFAWPMASWSEVWFFYPSIADGTGECSRYAKLNISEKTWDVGILARSIGIDQGVVEYPLAATVQGLIYQHEDGNSADGQPMNAYVESGDVMLAEGDTCIFVDQVRPDMKYGYVGEPQDANMSLTITAANDVIDSEMVETMAYSDSTIYLAPRVRGHRFRFRIGSNDVGSWWRLGNMRYRGAPDGKI